MSRTLTLESGTGLILTHEEAIGLITRYTKTLYNKVKNHKDFAKINDGIFAYDDFEAKLNNNDTTYIEEEMDYYIGSELPILRADRMTTADDIMKDILSNADDRFKNYVILKITDIPNTSDTYGDIYITRFSKTINKIVQRSVYMTETLSDENSIIIYTEKSTLPQAFLQNESYHSVDEIIEEFKTKLGVYLPENFDYQSHIGYVKLALYA